MKKYRVGRGDPGGIGRFSEKAIFFQWEVARPGFSLCVHEIAFRLQSVPDIMGSTILARDNFQ